jgi:hypothetical protein
LTALPIVLACCGTNVTGLSFQLTPEVLRMGKRISEWLHRVSTGWVVLAGLAVFLAFSALVLPRQAGSAAATAGSAGSPDSSLFYTANALYRMAEAYGAQGRAAYVRARWTFDLAFPVVYTLFLATAVSWLLGKAFPSGSPWRRANLLPLLGMCFDYLENSATSLVMGRYPAHTPVVDMLAPVFTALKWGFIAASFLLLLVGLVLAASRRGRKPASPSIT